ncbi:NlpC/P60 family protein [Streptomyces melanosporofaciens]|uniref:Cell wall-associated hydrolase, NlpC family n=1 Tax=Streptomyces melanosporofaciens TaxID=67327 RepID=A0A1H4KNZ9_STRMJ|nr:bifunctional lytic transglycosylase/C40 family peptidase [Streptomyces melanosporofaciens]SEB59976.1 Cell wall-associated hydrolase, NlpC family [Streptomyces melanosporofaciens]
MVKVVAAILGAILLAITLAAAGASSALSIFGGTGGSQPNRAALTDIPPGYLALYQQAATTCPGLDWSVPAAIGKVETDHGRSTLPGVHSGSNHKGAEGPMQFLRPTFDAVTAKHPIPQAGSRAPSPYNPRDAIYTAVAYLCDSGARDGRNLHQAILAYNPAEWYVSKVLAQAQDYRSTSSLGSTAKASPSAREVINYAQGQLGLPYVWGGNGPAGGDAGFDCSGLTKAAYAAAGISLPRTAEEQFRTGLQVAKGQSLMPGDLVFYGNPHGRIHHVGLYIGSGQMINAPNFGEKIKIAPYRYQGDDYAGATRPAASASAGSV